MSADDPIALLRPVWAVVAGRMGSSRLPGKTMAPLAGRPSLRHIVERLRRVPELDGVVVATTEHPRDDVIRSCADEAGVPAFSGSEHDVLGRTLGAARSVGARTIVQVTGDCPLVDPAVVSRVLAAYAAERPDYASNVLGGLSYPAGLDVEVFGADVLAQVDAATSDPRDREHVSIYIYEHPERFRLLGVPAPPEHHRPELFLCIDTEADREVVRRVYDELHGDHGAFGLDEVLAFLDAHPDIAATNAPER
ncbi:MAG TPA: glycosyltransferase family protein [Capillimicrobium sp.]|jgi:spore coat polysaccharide biosynthesis protein SpsF